MPVGDKYAFLQFSDSVKTAAFSTEGVTVTFSTGAQPDPSVRVQNLSTATCWIGLGTRSTSSAAVTANGIMIPPATQAQSMQIIRTGGETTLAAFPIGDTITTRILVTGGEGVG
jgi:hypothetical protein